MEEALPGSAARSICSTVQARRVGLGRAAFEIIDHVNEIGLDHVAGIDERHPVSRRSRNRFAPEGLRGEGGIGGNAPDAAVGLVDGDIRAGKHDLDIRLRIGKQGGDQQETGRPNRPLAECRSKVVS